MIARVSDEILTYLRVHPSDDGSPITLGRETYVETIRDVSGIYDLYLSRRPIASVTSIVSETETLVEGTDFLVRKPVGGLSRLQSDDITPWSSQKIVVTYVAGYLLPEEEGRNLPYDIEDAAHYTIKSRINELNAEVGEQELKSENVQGVYSVSYVTSGATETKRGTSLPDRAVQLLSSYRNLMV